MAETRETNSKDAQHDLRKRQKLSGPTATTTQSEDGNGLKRKHGGKTDDAAPPNKKLQEFLDVYAPSAKSNTWSNAVHESATVSIAEAGEDDEYVELPALKTISEPGPAPEPTIPEPTMEAEDGNDAGTQTDDEDKKIGPVSDADWLRSKTTRLLDLTDDVSSRLTMADSKSSTPAVAQPSATNIPAQAQDDVAEAKPEQSTTEREEAIEKIASTGRLFVRNLSYSATEGDLRQHFSRFGDLEEVCTSNCLCICTPRLPRNPVVFVMKKHIGTSYIFVYMSTLSGIQIVESLTQTTVFFYRIWLVIHICLDHDANERYCRFISRLITRRKPVRVLYMCYSRRPQTRWRPIKSWIRRSSKDVYYISLPHPPSGKTTWMNMPSLNCP